MKRIPIVALVLAVLRFASEGFEVVSKIQIGGAGKWDSVGVDPDSNRIQASHATFDEVVDTRSGKVVEQITHFTGCKAALLRPTPERALSRRAG